ncbi:hypothetical protein VB691_22405 [Crocosphaera sp. XPORK-15E]|nr:hypothetical protein [Crocosphaera sp. XPORK-15E]
MLRIVTHDRTKGFIIYGKTVRWLPGQLTKSRSVNDSRIMPPKNADADESY